MTKQDKYNALKLIQQGSVQLRTGINNLKLFLPIESNNMGEELDKIILIYKQICDPRLTQKGENKK
jgi:hypothetical protein